MIVAGCVCYIGLVAGLWHTMGAGALGVGFSSNVVDKYNQPTVDDNNIFNTTASATKSKALKKSTRKIASKKLSVTYDDTTLMKFHEAISGIVLEEYKLVIFTNPKIGSTVSGYSVVSKNTTTVTHQY